MTLGDAAADIAHGFLGEREQPLGSNRSPWIDRWVKEGGGLDQPATGKGYAYCASFVSWCIKEAMKRVGGPFRFVFGASVLKLRNANQALLVKTPPVGAWVVFLILHADGTGHCGFGRARGDGILETREANTGPGPAVPAKDRDGDGYYERADRHVTDCSGFLLIG